MVRIPSTEQTDDFIYRFEVKQGEPPYDPNIPNLLVFEGHVDPAARFHSMDILITRDGERAFDIDFRSFELQHGKHMNHIKLVFHEPVFPIAEHNYLLTIILRYLVS